MDISNTTVFKTKSEIIEKLQILFGHSGASEVADKAKVSRQSVHKWLTTPARKSDRIWNAAVDVIEEETKVFNRG